MTKLIGRRVDRHPVMATYTFNRFLFSKRSSHGDIKYLKIKLDEITTLTPTVPSKADKKWDVLSTGCVESPTPDVWTPKTSSLLGKDASRGCTKELNTEGEPESRTMEVMDEKEESGSLVMWQFAQGMEGVFVQESTTESQKCS